MNNPPLPESDYLFIIEQAAKAPSGHNTQPWKFIRNPNGIDIYPDFTKSLPVVDPDNRELFISLGCAAENLCIAAVHKGYQPSVSIDNKNHIIHIQLGKQESIPSSSLFPQLSVRQTNRRVYNGNSIADSDIALLQRGDAEPGIRLHFFKNGTQEFARIAELVYEGNRRQMQDEKFKAELQQWMRYNKKHQDATRDGLSYAVFGAPNLPCFISKFIIAQTLNAQSQNKADRKKIAATSHFILFTSQNNTLEEWINLGRTLERTLLKTTEMGISHAYMNPPNEIPELSKQMAEQLAITNEYPTILIRVGYGEKMPYSLRRNVG